MYLSHFKNDCSLISIFITTKKNIIIIGPYEISFISIFIFLYSVLMVKYNFIKSKNLSD